MVEAKANSELKAKTHLSRAELYTIHEGPPSKPTFWSAYIGKYDTRQKVFAGIMLVLVVVESAFLFLQAAKGFRTQSTKDVDMSAFILLLIINVAWTFYGWLVVKDLPIMMSGILYVLGAALVLTTIFLYGKNDGCNCPTVTAVSE
jgi:uncharacterized protein with PQ loop repeat